MTGRSTAFRSHGAVGFAGYFGSCLIIEIMLLIEMSGRLSPRCIIPADRSHQENAQSTRDTLC
jgi:hypothetical protein